jgi:hypothetical protein
MAMAGRFGGILFFKQGLANCMRRAASNTLCECGIDYHMAPVDRLECPEELSLEC